MLFGADAVVLDALMRHFWRFLSLSCVVRLRGGVMAMATTAADMKMVLLMM